MSSSFQLCTIAVGDSCGGGSGTEVDPYLVYDANQMNAIAARTVLSSLYRFDSFFTRRPTCTELPPNMTSEARRQLDSSYIWYERFTLVEWPNEKILY